MERPPVTAATFMGEVAQLGQPSEVSIRLGLIRVTEDALRIRPSALLANRLLGLLGLPHFGPALPLRLGDTLTGFFAQDSLTSPGAPVRAAQGS